MGKIIEDASEPTLILSLASEDRVRITLIIKGKENIYPELVSIYDGIILMDLLATILKIPMNRRMGTESFLSYKGPFSTAHWSPADAQMYGRITTDWLTNGVQPKLKFRTHTYAVNMDRIFKTYFGKERNK